MGAAGMVTRDSDDSGGMGDRISAPKPKSQTRSVTEISRADAEDGSSFADFDYNNLDQSLKKIHREAIRRSENTVNWYCGARRRKRMIATPVRFATIFFFGLAGAMPLLTNAGLLSRDMILSMGPWHNAAIDLSQMGYLFAAFATALIGFDKFFGLSGGWARYMVAEVNVRKAAMDFESDWLMASTCMDADEKTCGKKRIALIKTFLAKVNDIVSDETLQWVADFQNSIGLLEKNNTSSKSNNGNGSAKVQGNGDNQNTVDNPDPKPK